MSTQYSQVISFGPFHRPHRLLRVMLITRVRNYTKGKALLLFIDHASKVNLRNLRTVIHLSGLGKWASDAAFLWRGRWGGGREGGLEFPVFPLISILRYTVISQLSSWKRINSLPYVRIKWSLKHLNLNSLLLLSIARIHSLYNYRTRYLREKILLTDSQCIECKYRPLHVKVMLHETIRNDDF